MSCPPCRLCFIFFFKQKTAYEMRISDWSSDVCSSDLAGSSKTTIQVLRPSASAAATARGDLAGSPCHGDKPRPTAIANVNKWVGVCMGRGLTNSRDLARRDKKNHSHAATGVQW